MMDGHYDPRLVALSVAIAIIASYTALDLAGCVSSKTSTPRKSWTWLIAGAVSLGTGIWSMHFIGMLAFQLPVEVAYSLPISFLSLMIAVAVSAIALFILRRPQLSVTGLLVGATLVGFGISSMHYSGMFAMQMSPPIRYDPLLFVTSIMIAIGASLTALIIGLTLRTKHSRLAFVAKIASAAVMGFAIAGMHYTGMAAAHFAAGSICLGATAGGIDNTALAAAIAVSTVTILTLTLVVSALDAHFALTNTRLAESLQKATRQLHAAQGELLTSARQAGMAEIANNVLHNVGNVLNSVNISAGLVSDIVRESKGQALSDAVQLMNQHSAHLSEFFSDDPKGKVLPGYLSKLVVVLASERDSVISELGLLMRSVDHIRDIVVTQQSYAGNTSVIEGIQINDLMDDALRIKASALTQFEVTVIKEFADIPLLLLDKHLVLQILVNLIGNAGQATDGVLHRPHQVTLRVDIGGERTRQCLRVRVEDNGEGIPRENLEQLFIHGFTTRKKGHGFGLHSCALAAKEMGGSLAVHSDGSGKGAVFTLELPARAAGALK
jgi:NO-binding membrane sensor protein with MHYT domain